MPTYSYVCDACGHKFDQIQGMNDAAMKTCTVCESDSLRRLIGGGAGLIFKGSGFYITDYARKNGGGAHGKAGKSNDSGKPESKSKTKSTSDSSNSEK